jgi:drug/metabolite transporter (DMT)-like permease
VAISVVGCALVAASGGRVSIEPLGVVLALAAAATFALYVFLGARVGTHTDPMVTSGWVALGAATTCALRAVAGPGYAATAGHWPALVGNGLANVAAFGLMFVALDRLGAARASVVFTLEAVFTMILSALVLHDSLAPLQVVGAAAVLTAAATVLGSQQETEIVEHEVGVP